MESPEEIKQRATKAYQKRDFVGAISLYSEAQQLDEKNEVYPSNKAACYYEMGAYSTAISHCDEALVLVKNKDGDETKKVEFEAKVLVRKGKALVHGGGKFSVAIACLERAQEICPKYFNSNSSFSSLLKYCKKTSQEGFLDDTLDEVLEEFLEKPQQQQQNEDKFSVHLKDLPIHRGNGFEPLGTEFFPVGHDCVESYLGSLADLAEGAKQISPFHGGMPPPENDGDEDFVLTCASSREFVKNIPPLSEEQQKILRDIDNKESSKKQMGANLFKKMEDKNDNLVQFRKTDPFARYRPEQFSLRQKCPIISTYGHLRVHLDEQSNDDLSKLSFLAGGIGDGRHLLATLIDVIGQVSDLERSGKHEEVQRLKQNINMKVIASDISPETHARNIFVWLLIEKIGRYFEGKNEGEVDDSFLDLGEEFVAVERRGGRRAVKEGEGEGKGGKGEEKEGEGKGEEKKEKEKEEGKEEGEEKKETMVQKLKEQNWFNGLTEGQGELAALSCILYYVMSCAFMPRPLYFLFHRIVKVLIEEAENALKKEKEEGNGREEKKKDICVGGWLDRFSIIEEKEGEGEEKGEGEGEGEEEKKEEQKQEEEKKENEEEESSPSLPSPLPSLPCDWLVIEGEEALKACLKVWKSWLGGNTQKLIDPISRGYRPCKLTEDMHANGMPFGNFSMKLDEMKGEQERMLEGMLQGLGDDQIDGMLMNHNTLYNPSDSADVKRSKLMKIMKEVMMGPGGGLQGFHFAVTLLSESLKTTNLPPVPLEYAALVSSGLMWRMSGLKKGDVDVDDMHQEFAEKKSGGGKNEPQWRRPFYAFPGVGNNLKSNLPLTRYSPNLMLKQREIVVNPSNMLVTSLLRYTLNPTAFPDNVFDPNAMAESVCAYNLEEILDHFLSSNILLDPKIPNIVSSANAYRLFSSFIRTAAIGLHWLGRRGEEKEGSQIKICVSLEDVHRRMLTPLLNHKKEDQLQETKFTRIFLSNIPDYTSVLGTFLDVKGVLGGKNSCLVFNNMYNPPLWKNLDQFLHSSLFLTTKQLPTYLKMEQAGGSLFKEMVFSLSSSPNSSSLALSVPPQNLALSRVEFETWLVTVLLSLGLPTIRHLGMYYEHRAPTMQRWFLLILHLIENDIVPRHWVSEALESVLTNSVKTKARVPHGSPCETPFSAQVAKNTKVSIDLSPLLIELQTLASFYLPLFGSSSPNGDLGSFFALPHTLPLSIPPREQVRKYCHDKMGNGKSNIGQALLCVGFLVFDEAWAKYSKTKVITPGFGMSPSFGKAVHEYFKAPKSKRQGQLHLFSCVEFHNYGTGTDQSGSLFLSEEDFKELVSLKMMVMAIRCETYEAISGIAKLSEFKPE